MQRSSPWSLVYFMFLCVLRALLESTHSTVVFCHNDCQEGKARRRRSSFKLFSFVFLAHLRKLVFVFLVIFRKHPAAEGPTELRQAEADAHRLWVQQLQLQVIQQQAERADYCFHTIMWSNINACADSMLQFATRGNKLRFSQFWTIGHKKMAHRCVVLSSY